MSILQFVGPVFISKEFKENQTVNVVKETKEAVHLIPWLNHLFRRDKPRYIKYKYKYLSHACMACYLLFAEPYFYICT